MSHDGDHYGLVNTDHVTSTLASDWSAPANDGHVRITSNANTMDTDPHQGSAHGIMISGMD